MAYTYSSFKTALAAALAVDESDADFVALLPTIIDLTEQVCYRELDLVDASVAVNGTATANSRYFTLPTSSGHILVVDAVNTFDASNVRHPAVPATRDVIDFVWPSDTAPSATSVPQIFCRPDDTRLLFGPAPGFAATVEIVGTIRPDPLSASNTTTFLTSYLSDLFFAGAMMNAMGTLLRNFGAQADNPQAAVSWQGVFTSLLASAQKEELRKNYISAMSQPPASVKA